MNNNTIQKGSTAKTVIIAVFVGLIVAAIGLTMVKTNKKVDQATTAQSEGMARTDTAAADLRVTLNALEREHVGLASAATRRGFQGDPDFAAAAGELDTNSKAIAAAVGSVYGPEAEAKFYEIWASHIGFFVDYTVAAKGGNKAGMDKAVADLGGYQNAIADFLSSANPNLPRQAVFDLVGEHIGLLKGAVDAYGGKDYPLSYAKEHEANVQIGTIADALSGAIVKQYPDKFK
ncbi:MAG TPA: hypothetical protein VM077_00440 [Candidatus Limnocylindrales bacterium]|nr:hypothetical protein [Candidatus Limnocylindrales bacterium]